MAKTEGMFFELLAEGSLEQLAADLGLTLHQNCLIRVTPPRADHEFPKTKLILSLGQFPNVTNKELLMIYDTDPVLLTQLRQVPYLREFDFMGAVKEQTDAMIKELLGSTK